MLLPLQDAGMREQTPQISDELAAPCETLDMHLHIIRWSHVEQHLRPEICQHLPAGAHLHPLQLLPQSDAFVKVIGYSSLRGEGGELGTNKNFDLWLQLVCTKLKFKTSYLDVQLGCSSVKLLSQKSLATYSLSYQETILGK